MRALRLNDAQIDQLVAEFRAKLKSNKGVKNGVTVKNRPKAKLIFTDMAWSKAKALTRACEKEIAWHYLVYKTREEDIPVYTITDVIVFPQTVTGATVTSDDTEYSNWVMQLPDEIFNSMHGHGHSHVSMGVTPSGVDINYQEDILDNLETFYIFTIQNKQEALWIRIADVEDNLVYDTTDITTVIPDDNIAVWAKTNIEHNVRTKVYTSRTKNNDNDFNYKSWAKWLTKTEESGQYTFEDYGYQE